MARMSVEKRRELLLEAAFRVIARDGVDRATTRAISAEAEMTLSTFHYVFDSRDDLLAALVQRGTDSEISVIAEALTAAADDLVEGYDGIRLMLRESLIGYIDGVVADPEREQAMISLNQYARQTTGLEWLGADMYRRYYAAIADGLTLAAVQARVEWDRPVTELAPLLVAATDGITLAYLNTRDRSICDRIAEATVILMLGHVVRR
ncbi:TetR family transcriptional regulator [Gordonia sp. HNM0687]|uniref:TetR family transcriptional regulator n=1 Tax=Gordonia mangrovi TaxID=2665643 RepID=A0A6L7GRN4_9ACTN|nr:TetR family transcriptional regulator [Gordonia mangrovi]MXP22576.1 TetR family transcriptional regulator [Gordonia mangrovi]UVF77552.1 TetR family transcriptional regulator [Gordonia mangrovi]